MIEPEKLALARIIYQMKLGNAPGWQMLCKGLQDMADPEHKRFVAASTDHLQRCQGRVQMITEILEVFFRCEEIVNPPQRPPRAVPPHGSWASGTAEGDLLNG